RRADAEPGTGLLHPTVTGQDLYRRLEALLGFFGSVELVHVFPSCWIASTHGRVLSRTSPARSASKTPLLALRAGGLTIHCHSLPGSRRWPPALLPALLLQAATAPPTSMPEPPVCAGVPLWLLVWPAAPHRGRVASAGPALAADSAPAVTARCPASAPSFPALG